MEWLENGVRLLFMLLPIISSVLEASSVEVLPSQTTTTGTTSSPNLQPPLSSSATSSVRTSSIAASNSPMMDALPTHTPLPTPGVPTTPGPRTMFIKYQNDSLALIIQDIDVSYENVQFHTSNLTSLPIINTTLHVDKASIKLERFYLLQSELDSEEFYISFTFRRTKDQLNWFIENFQHQNYTEEDDQRFQYRGINYISAPVGQAYMCPTMTLHGTTAKSGDDPEDNTTLTSDLTFSGITVEPFTKNGRLSPGPVMCGDEPPSEEGLDVRPIIGVVGGVCGVSLLSSLVVAAGVMIKSRRRGYDILRT